MKKFKSFVFALLLIFLKNGIFAKTGDFFISSDGLITVTTADEGLIIEKKADSKFINGEIHVFSGNKEKNFYLINSEKENSNQFVYPFVSKGTSYKVYAVLYNKNFTESLKTETVEITAANGLGEAFVDIANPAFDSENVCFHFDKFDLKIPVSPREFEGNFILDLYDFDDKKIFSTNDIYKSNTILDVNFIYEKVKNLYGFSMEVDYVFNYAGNTYKKNVIHKSGKKYTYKDFNVEGADKVYRDESSYVTVVPTMQGLYIKKNLPANYTNAEIHVKGEDYENLTLLVKDEESEIIYPFVEKNKKYKVFIKFTDKKTQKVYTTEGSSKGKSAVNAVEVKAIGGIGDYYFSSGKIVYDSKSRKIVFKDGKWICPIKNNFTISGNFYTHSQKKGKWEKKLSGESVYYLTEKMEISLKDSPYLSRGLKNFHLDLTGFTEYEYSGQKYTYKTKILNNEKQSDWFTDTNEILLPTYSSLPEVRIKTSKGKFKDSTYRFGDDWQEASLKIYDKDYPLEEVSFLIKDRGNSTKKTGKTPFSMKFENKVSFLGMEKGTRWVLLANYFDRSLIRSDLAGNIGNNVFNYGWQAKFTPVNLFINNKYLGIYDLGEAVQVSDKKINIQSIKDIGKKKYKDLNGDGKISLEDGGFVVEIDTCNTEKYNFHSTQYRYPFNLKFPDEVTDEQFKYVKKIINNFENTMVTKQFLKDFLNYIDLDSFVDWYLFNEFAKNSDAIFQKSVFIGYNPETKKIFMGPNWDFDIAFGNFSDADCDKPEGWFIHGGKKYSNEDPYLMKLKGDGNVFPIKNYWINRLFEIPEFKKAVKDRWMEKAPLLKKEIDRIQELADYIADTVPLSEKVIPRLGKESWNGPVGYKDRKTYQSEVDYLKDWCNKRYTWMDSQISAW